jgi:hypothetical protein
MTPEALDTLLTGTQVRLWPYAPSVFPRDLLYHVWARMEAEHAWPKLFWWQDVPDREKGDLCAFASYLRDKTPLLVETHGPPGRPLHERLGGLIWFDEAVRGLRANISIWFARAAWGDAAQEAGVIATRYAHQALQLPAIWGVSPWQAAIRYGVRCGYRPVCTLPHYIRIHGKPMPLHYILHEEHPYAGPL